MNDAIDAFRRDFETLRSEIAKVIVGHDAVIEDTLIALIAGGHVLLEGAPGLGKTRLVRALADSLHVHFARVQFTPDLMPTDLTGTNVVVESDAGKRFEFQPGPVFAEVVLADEINRATPKTQSALLEAMQECSVTVAGQTHALPRPFFVMATQNPLEMEGTYPLPEAQLDRFFFKLMVDYPDMAGMEAILDRTTETDEPAIGRVCDGARIGAMGELVRQVPISDDVRRYGIALVLAGHPDNQSATDKVKQYVRYGASPRAAQAMILAAKIRAILDGRFAVARDDLRAAAKPAMRHRLILNFEAQADRVQPDRIIDDMLARVNAG